MLSAIVVPTMAVGGMKAHTTAPIVGTLAAACVESPDRGFIIKPTASNVTPTKRAVQTYSVQDGDTVSGIADQFGLTVDTVRWANNMSDVDTLSLGQQLLIPPVNGVLLTTKDGDTISALAAKYGVPAGTIIDFNLIHDPNNLKPGTQLMIADGTGAPAPQKAPPPPAPSSGGSSPFGVTRFAGGSGGHFPWGYCTWYVSTRRYIPWMGDAHSWYANAQAYGFAVGHTPAVGAIMVTWESWWGHVAYVESVSGSCWTVSEMNYAGFGIVDYRHICPGQVPLIGFVY
ncbi:MAG TPA: LysM peptidoglycan-binding domain-containing protein [Gemmatimonadales bacterium]|nr:LysM peptidoglycan-binding domain-containing protein [Gemmatimonadales bacterium]